MNKSMITLLAGVAMGLLLAPAKGSETLKRVVRRLKDLKDQLTDSAEKMYITTSDMIVQEENKNAGIADHNSEEAF